MGIAMLTKQEHWNLHPNEAEAMSQSIANVARHYPSVAKSQKLVDWAMLIQAVGFAYVPRIMHSQGLAKEARNSQPNPMPVQNGMYGNVQ